jgi:hypothetical protein
MSQLEIPEGHKVWYEYGVTNITPNGRRLYGVARRFVRAHLVNADREEVAVGMAVCNPVDPFVKKIGRTKALARALYR